MMRFAIPGYTNRNAVVGTADPGRNASAPAAPRLNTAPRFSVSWPRVWCVHTLGLFAPLALLPQLLTPSAVLSPQAECDNCGETRQRHKFVHFSGGGEPTYVLCALRYATAIDPDADAAPDDPSGRRCASTWDEDSALCVCKTTALSWYPALRHDLDEMRRAFTENPVYHGYGAWMPERERESPFSDSLPASPSASFSSSPTSRMHTRWFCPSLRLMSRNHD